LQTEYEAVEFGRMKIAKIETIPIRVELDDEKIAKYRVA
jgi:hypothetical protein